MLNEPIVLGVGWKDIKIGTKYLSISEKLGPPDEEESCLSCGDKSEKIKILEGAYLNYYFDGIQIYLDFLFYENYDFWFENHKLVSMGMYLCRKEMNEEEIGFLADYWENKISTKR